MNIQTENANQFDDREACLQWIDDRVVRFKLRMVKAATQTPGEFTYIPQKEEGKIVNTLAEGFKESGTDEPLSNYASPVKQDGKWLAVMMMQE
jgi:hypothetical protein